MADGDIHLPVRGVRQELADGTLALLNAKGVGQELLEPVHGVLGEEEPAGHKLVLESAGFEEGLPVHVVPGGEDTELKLRGRGLVLTDLLEFRGAGDEGEQVWNAMNDAFEGNVPPEVMAAFEARWPTKE